MSPRDGRETVIVVPDGLAYDSNARRALAEPSFVFRSVLQHVLDRYSDRRVLVAPANAFGGPQTEHEVAAAWLRARGCGAVETPTIPAGGGYIDTWGNALELRRWLSARREWPLGPCVLVVAFRHAARARLCFTRNGYDLVALDAVRYGSMNEPIVPRLFYYRYPVLHRCYELAAWIRDRLRTS